MSRTAGGMGGLSTLCDNFFRINTPPTWSYSYADVSLVGQKVPHWGPNGSARCFILWQSSLTRRWPSLMAFHHKVPYGLYSEWAKMVWQHLAGSVFGIHKGNTYNFLVRWMYIYIYIHTHVIYVLVCIRGKPWTYDIYIYIYIYIYTCMHLFSCTSLLISHIAVYRRSWALWWETMWRTATGDFRHHVLIINRVGLPVFRSKQSWH